MELELHDLTQYRGTERILNRVSLRFEASTVTGLIGPNGSGKTTLFDSITGFIVPAAGRVLIAGTDVTGSPPYVIARTGIGRLFQDVRLFASMSAIENVMVACEASDADDPYRVLRSARAMKSRENRIRADAERCLESVGASDYAMRLAAELSHGQRKLVGLARVLGTRPKVLLLDEPFVGLERYARTQLLDVFLRLRRDDCAIVIVAHEVDMVAATCDQIFALKDGQVRPAHSQEH